MYHHLLSYQNEFDEFKTEFDINKFIKKAKEDSQGN